MLYCDPAWYSLHGGGAIPENQRDIWLQRASRKIDRFTHGRASSALVEHPDALKEALADACAQIADLLFTSRQARMAAAMGLSAATNDGISETYTDAQRAAAALEQSYYQALQDALGNDPYNLLYAGVI